MRTLYTAFKGVNNTSFQLVTALNKPFLLLTNSFQGLQRDLSSVKEPYDTVIMFGVDKALKDCVRFEGCAEYSGDLLNSTFCTETLTRKCVEMMIPHSISFKPAKHLCNAAYWHMLQKVSNTIFVHIPSAGSLNSDFMKQLIALFT